MEGRPTTSMKKGWLCRTFYDQKNHEIAPVMIQQRWSRSKDDAPEMIQIQWWWSRSRDDIDPGEDDLKMKITWRWRWLEDEDDLNMDMTWRWRWRRIDDDPDDTENKTCANKLCRENTFLVKRECWCNCNLEMYSLVFLMYCTPIFIPGSVCNVVESCHAPMFWLGVSIM